MFQLRYKMMAAAVALAAVSMGVLPARAADNPREKEQQLIKIIESDAPAKDKAIPCKQLAIYGSSASVPALARLLPDRELSSWARIALEAIPGPEADEALRDAMGKVEGRQLIGVINSVGYRKDRKAVAALAAKLKTPDPEVIAAAGSSLGKVGGDQAAGVLLDGLKSGEEAVRAASAEGAVYCAEGFLAAGDRDWATRLYDAVRSADVPKQRVIEATRGAIIARGTAGLPLLVEQLRSSGAFFLIGLRVARELPGAEVTDALLAEMAKPAPERQALLLYALGDRGDEKALAAVQEAARGGAAPVRIAAVNVLEKLGKVSSIPVLLEAAASEDAELSKAAKTTLARLKGADVEKELFTRLEQSSGKMRQVLIQLAEERKLPGALAVFMKSASDADGDVRAAALTAIGALGEEKQAQALIGMLGKAQDDQQRLEIENAILSICGRWQAACTPDLLALSRSNQPAERITAVHGFAVVGGGEALDAVKHGLEDADGGVRDEAVRTLSTWPNRWPEDRAVVDPLLGVIKSPKKPQHQVLAIRGYIQFFHGAKGVGAQEKVAKLNDILPMASRAEEKRLVISALGAIGTGASLEPLESLAGDATVGDEACSAIMNVLARNARGATREQKLKALQTVAEKSHSDALKTRAKEQLNRQ